MKRKDQLIGSGERSQRLLKGNESIPVSVQPLWFIIAAVFFSGWEMPKRSAQTKQLPLLLFYHNISFLTIPCLRLSQAPLSRVRQRKTVFTEGGVGGCHLGDKREKWWHYDAPVMLIKIRERVHSAMFHWCKTITFCIKRNVIHTNPVCGFCIEDLSDGHPPLPSVRGFTTTCHFAATSSQSQASAVMGLCEVKHDTCVSFYFLVLVIEAFCNWYCISHLYVLLSFKSLLSNSALSLLVIFSERGDVWFFSLSLS